MSSLKLQELFGWPIAQTEAPNGETHYYNLVHGAPLDVTADQFDGPVTYDNEPVERNRLLDHPGTAARYETLSAVVERELDRRLDAADIEHVCIRVPSYVAGSSEKPEVGVFVQTHTKYQPLNAEVVRSGQTVWMKWSSGPVVAASTILSWHPGSFTNGNVNELRERCLGTKLFGLDAYWEEVRGKVDGHYCVVRLANERWLDPLTFPVGRSRGSSWVYLDTHRKKLQWTFGEEPVPTSGVSGRRTPMSASMRFLVLKRDEFTCRYCGRQAPNVKLHVDHVVPWSVVGEHKLENLVAACSDCNLGKGTMRL